jgi:hypothetical protein
VLLNPLPFNVDFRVESLIACLWHACVASVRNDESEADAAAIAAAVGRFTAVWNDFHSHGSSRFRLLALNALHRYILVPPHTALSHNTLQYQQRAIMTLLAELTPTLML